MSTMGVPPPAPAVPEGALDASDVLAFTRQARADIADAQVRLLQGAAEWVVLHATCAWGDAEATLPDTDVPLSLTGEGAPAVRETAVVEFGAAVGMSSTSARNLLGSAAELVYRLPKLWHRVQAGQVETWRARRITDHTGDLTYDAARWVDAELAPFAHSCGITKIERAVAQAQARFAVPQVLDAELAEAGRRGVRVDPMVGIGGTVGVELTLEAADASDFDRAVARMAEHLAREGSTAELDARRALAVGEIARAHLASPLSGVRDDGRTVITSPRPATQIYLHLHAGEQHPEAATPMLQVGNQRGGMVSAEAVKRWLEEPGARVVVKPVIDLNRDESSSGVVVPDRLVDRLYLRDRQCVFPWCGRRARPPSERQTTDADHVFPSGRGGLTTLSNLAPLCRRHHRHKTHFGWSYTPLRTGRFLWTAPDGARYLRAGDDTVPLGQSPPPTRREPPPARPSWRHRRVTLPAPSPPPARDDPPF
jgi:hypothetical protein